MHVLCRIHWLNQTPRFKGSRPEIGKPGSETRPCILHAHTPLNLTYSCAECGACFHLNCSHGEAARFVPRAGAHPHHQRTFFGPVLPFLQGTTDTALWGVYLVPLLLVSCLSADILVPVWRSTVIVRVVFGRCLWGRNLAEDIDSYAIPWIYITVGNCGITTTKALNLEGAW